MYIERFSIKNIRAIEHFDMSFSNPAGWHVLIGNNGSGKSTILKALALTIIGPDEIRSLRIDLYEWINRNADFAEIDFIFKRHDSDGYTGNSAPFKKPIMAGLKLSKPHEDSRFIKIETLGGSRPHNYIWSGRNGWFSASFGPFRRFTGGDKEWGKVYYSSPKAAPHLSVFGESVALSESLEWLQELQFKNLEQSLPEQNLLARFMRFINEGQLLPHNAKISRITSDGVEMRDSHNHLINVTEMSDGFRSILSLTFELIRQMVRSYGASQVFEPNKTSIDVPGVVLIDEIDAHLHPTWQTEIGKWFTKYFPNIQFIVSTHSPLVCRACENGSIWRLATPDTNQDSGEVTGIERERLIHGNILDAYGTELFGVSPVRSEKSNEKLARLGELNRLSAFGKISTEQEKERLTLQKILSADAPTGF
jgi:predicted ATPase